MEEKGCKIESFFEVVHCYLIKNVGQFIKT